MLLTLFEHAEELTHRTLDAGAAYQRLVTTGFKRPYPKHTAIVQIRQEDAPQEVTLVNVCQQRLFLSRVLGVIQSAGPAVVVIDKHFSRDSCPKQPEGTVALHSAIRGLLEQKIPVIVGIDSDPSGRLLPIVDFPTASNGRRVQLASVSFNDDVRRAAFGWSDFKDDSGNPLHLDTLSFASAVASMPDLLQVNDRLRTFHHGGIYPWVVFFPSNGFDSQTFSAIRLLCGSQADSGADWRACSSPDAQALARLRGRVVLLGEVEPGVDQHDTVVGTMPGLWLHANYIEGILNDDLLRPVSPWITNIYGLLVFLLVELALLTGRSRLFKAGVAVGIIVAAYGICYFIVQLTGVFLNPGLGLVALVFAQLAEATRRWLIPSDAAAVS